MSNTIVLTPNWLETWAYDDEAEAITDEATSQFLTVFANYATKIFGQPVTVEIGNRDQRADEWQSDNDSDSVRDEYEDAANDLEIAYRITVRAFETGAVWE